MDTARANRYRLWLPRRIALAQFATVALLAAVSAATILWIPREHNRLAALSARQMISGGIVAFSEQLRVSTIDYSIWADAFEAIRTGDSAWIWENIGMGAADTGTTDLMIIVEPGETRQYGWVSGMGEVPSSELLPVGTIEAMLRLLDDVPIAEATAVSRFMVADGATWLLAIARVRPPGEIPPSITDTDMPRHLFGLRLDSDTVAELGAQFLIDDLHIASTPAPGKSSLPLMSFEGEPVNYLVWAPPRPGKDLAWALVLALGAIVLATALASRHILHSARELEAAQEADRAKTAFLANVSHELRTPMNGIIGMGQLIQATPLEPKIARMMEVLMTSARYQMTLIEDLLEYARIDLGALQMNPGPFDPALAVTEVCEFLAPKASEKGIDLRFDVPAVGRFSALGDKGRYQQVVTNLVDNAIKFTNDGHVAVTLQATEGRDDVELALSVADTGPGIDPKDHQRIFERFVQVDHTLRRAARGSGLGLTITKSLVELMGGRLRLDSELGKGAVFSVDLAFRVPASRTARVAAE